MRMLWNPIEAQVIAPDAQLNLLFGNLRRVLREEVSDVKPRLLLAQGLMHLLPIRMGCRVRVQLLRMIGFKIGHGTMLLGNTCIIGTGDIYTRLTVGHHCIINVGWVLDLEETITIGDNVGIGHDVMLLTSSHAIGPEGHRVGDDLVQPVSIGDGVWLGARTTVLPGVMIGAGTVVSAGSVVTRSVPPNSLVAGAPARLVKRLS